MPTQSEEIPLVLLRDATWLVGIDAASVRSFVRGSQEAEGRLVQLAELMSGAAPAAARVGATGTRRGVVVEVDGDNVTLVVDQVIGVMSMPAGQMAALPVSLRHFGAPAWLLGTTWLDDDLVLLVRFAGALASTQ